MFLGRRREGRLGGLIGSVFGRYACFALDGFQRFLVMAPCLLHVLAGFIVPKEDRVLRRLAKLIFQIPKGFESRVEVIEQSSHGHHRELKTPSAM